METEYGYVKYIGETSELMQVYIYDIKDIFVRAAIMDERPYISIIRTSKTGRQYFIKNNQRVYVDELEEINVI